MAEEDFAFDFSGIKNILDNDRLVHILFITFLLIVPIGVSIYIRTMPARLPIAADWARQGIQNNIRNQVAQDLAQRFPNMDPQSREQQINQQAAQIIAQQQAQIDQAVDQQAKYFRERFRDENGYTYLGDIDSYFWARYARNIVETGQPGDTVQDGRQWDDHMLAPKGMPVTSNIYYYIEAFLHSIFTIFDSDIPIMTTAFYTPLVLSIIAIIAAFFIGRQVSGNFAGFIAAMLIAVNPTILSRSLGSDNDIVNAVFPLLIMLFTFLAFETKQNKQTIIYSAFAGLLIGMYSFAWTGWWFMFLFIIGAAMSYMAYQVVYDIVATGKTKENIMQNLSLRSTGIMLGVFLAASFISLALFGNAGGFFRSFTNPLSIIAISEATRGSIWPNVYTTVAELNAANTPQIISSLGGIAFGSGQNRVFVSFLLFALVGTVLPLVRFRKDVKWVNLGYLAATFIYFAIILNTASERALNILLILALVAMPLGVGLLLSLLYKYRVEAKHSILLVIWFMATMYAATKGIRFILLIVPAFVISLSLFFGKITEWLSEAGAKSLEISAPITRAVIVIIVLLLLFNPVGNASQLGRGIATGYGYVPSVNDGWVDSLTKIREESAPDAIINSWWDFGHWFKFWADRAVTFDGASQNDQRAHWIGKVLLTQDEDQAVAILRMLDCGGDTAYIEIYSITEDQYATVNMMYDFLEMGQQATREDLLSLTDAQKADTIIDAMFCEPPENYFITSEDMVGKSGVWAHFGSWNFDRARMYNAYRATDFEGFVDELEGMGFSEEESTQIYYELGSKTTDRAINDWIAPWPSYGGGVGCQQNNETLLCNVPTGQQALPIRINTSTMEAYIPGEETYHPNSFGYMEEGEFIIKEYDENTIGYGIVLVGNRLHIMHADLTGSMFTRLFYLNGQGLQHFDKFHDVTDVGGNRIITWKVDWDGEDAVSNESMSTV